MSFSSLETIAIPSNQLFILGQEKTTLLRKNSELKTKNAELIKLRDKLKKRRNFFGLTALASGIGATTTLTAGIVSNKNKTKLDTKISSKKTKVEKSEKKRLEKIAEEKKKIEAEKIITKINKVVEKNEELTNKAELKEVFYESDKSIEYYKKLLNDYDKKYKKAVEDNKTDESNNEPEDVVDDGETQKVKVCFANGGIKDASHFSSKKLKVETSYTCKISTFGVSKTLGGWTSGNCYIGTTLVAANKGTFTPKSDQVDLDCKEKIKKIATGNKNFKPKDTEFEALLLLYEKVKKARESALSRDEDSDPTELPDEPEKDNSENATKEELEALLKEYEAITKTEEEITESDEDFSKRTEKYKEVIKAKTEAEARNETEAKGIISPTKPEKNIPSPTLAELNTVLEKYKAVVESTKTDDETNTDTVRLIKEYEKIGKEELLKAILRDQSVFPKKEDQFDENTLKVMPLEDLKQWADVVSDEIQRIEIEKGL